MKKLLFIFTLLIGFASQGQVKVLGYVVPNSVADQYPTHVDTYGQGGFQSVNTLSERNAITTLRRKKGMLVYVADSVKVYQLGNDLITWTVFNSGSGTGGSNGSGEIDPVFLSHVAHTITQQNIDFWNRIALLPNYPTLDSVLSKIDSAGAAHDYNFDPVYFTVNNRNVTFNANFAEQDPRFLAHVASGITQQDIDRWNTTFDLTGYITRDSIINLIQDKKYTYYIDGKTILGTGSVDDPWHVVPFGDSSFANNTYYNVEQVDSAIAANSRQYYAGFGLTLDNYTFRLDSVYLINLFNNASPDTAVQDIIQKNGNTLTVVKKNSTQDIVFGGIGGSGGDAYTKAQTDSAIAANLYNGTELDPLFQQHVAHSITQPDIDRWNLFDTSLYYSKTDINNIFSDPTRKTYVDGVTILGDGTVQDPLHANGYSKEQVDSAVAANYHVYGAGYGLFLENSTFRLDTSLLRNAGFGGGNSYHIPYTGDATYYWGADSAFHAMPTFPNPNDSIDYAFSSMKTIFNENGPGERAVAGVGIAANPDNLVNPFRQLKAIDIGPWTNGDYVSFTAPDDNVTSYTFIRGFFRLKSVVDIPDYISFVFYNNGAPISNVVSIVNYGLDKNKPNVYQNISIQMSAFGFTSTTFDEIRLFFGGSNSSGIYLDLLQFQNATAIENSFLTDNYKKPGTDSVFIVRGGVPQFAYIDGGSVGSGAASRFGIEDNTSDTDRSVDMQQHNFDVDNIARLYLRSTPSGGGYSEIYGNGNNMTMTGQSGASDDYSTLNISPNTPSWTAYQNLTQSTILLSSFGIKFNQQIFNQTHDPNQTTNSSFILPNHAPAGGGEIIHYLPVSVNGNFADAAGNITVSGTGGGSAGVTSFSGRTGVVVPQSGDYSAYYAAVNHTQTASTITDFMSAARSAISVTGTGGSYNSATGVITLTGGGATEVKQTYTSGATVTIADGTTWMAVNPASTISALTITAPPNPVDAQKIEISFGGTLTTGTVVTALTIAGNTGQTILQATSPTSVEAGESVSFRYNATNSKWYRIN